MPEVRLSNSTFRQINGNVRLWGGMLNQWVVLLEDRELAAVAAKGERASLPEVTEKIRQWYWGVTNETISTKDIRATGLWRASIRLPEGSGRVQVVPWPLDLDPMRYVFVALEFVPFATHVLPWPWVYAPVFGSWDAPSSGLVAYYHPATAVHVPTAIEQALDTLERTGDELAEDSKRALERAKKLVTTSVPIALVVGGILLVLWARKG